MASSQQQQSDDGWTEVVSKKQARKANRHSAGSSTRVQRQPSNDKKFNKSAGSATASTSNSAGFVRSASSASGSSTSVQRQPSNEKKLSKSAGNPPAGSGPTSASNSAGSVRSASSASGSMSPTSGKSAPSGPFRRPVQDALDYLNSLEAPSPDEQKNFLVAVVPSSESCWHHHWECYIPPGTGIERTISHSFGLPWQSASDGKPNCVDALGELGLDVKEIGATRFRVDEKFPEQAATFSSDKGLFDVIVTVDVGDDDLSQKNFMRFLEMESKQPTESRKGVFFLKKKVPVKPKQLVEALKKMGWRKMFHDLWAYVWFAQLRQTMDERIKQRSYRSHHCDFSDRCDVDRAIEAIGKRANISS